MTEGLFLLHRTKTHFTDDTTRTWKIKYLASYHRHRTGLRSFFTHFFSKTHLHADLQLFKLTVQHAVLVEIYLPSVRCSEEAVTLIRKQCAYTRMGWRLMVFYIAALSPCEVFQLAARIMKGVSY